MNKPLSRALRCAAIASLALALPAGTLFAQPRTGTISGLVTEAAGGAPIAAAQVTITGTTIGALTNAEGRYTLRNVPAGAVVVRSARIGYAELVRPVTVNANEALTLDLSLSKVAVALAPIVATATGELNRSTIPNVITSIDASKTIENSQVSSVGDLLIGKAAGVQVLQGSGVGAASRVRIRGTSSISLSNDPIYIVDGIRINSQTSGLGTGGAQASRLNDINPEDIETMDVIRGPAASATYGTDAATGVIVITTKRGRTGPARWNFYTEQGVTRDRNQYPDAFTAWGKLANQTNSANNGRASDCLINTIAAGTCVVDSITRFNLWEDERATPLKSGDRRQYGMSVTGGSEAVSYFVAMEQESTTGTLGMPKFDQERLVRNGASLREEWLDPNTFQRFSIRTNLDLKISPTFQLPIRSYFLSSQLQAPQDGNNTTGLGSHAFGGPGTRNRTLTAGGTDSLYGYRQFTPGDIFQQYNNIDLQRWIGSISPNWTPTTWLAARGNVGLDYTSESFDNACLRDECPNFGQTRLGLKSTSRARQFQWTADWSATGTFRPLSWLSTRTTGGFQFIHRQDDSYNASGTQLPPGGTTLSQLAVANVSEGTTVSKTAGIFVEQNMTLLDKIDVTASVRGDQNSAFGENFGTAYYPRAGATYRISEESWFPLANQINAFRVRAVWGQAGIRPGTTASLRSFAANAYREVAADVPGIIFSTIGNQNLRPETVSEVEGGFDLGLFDDRITTSVTYYNKKSTDAIIGQTIAPSVGAGASKSVNIGAVRNSGWEYLLTVRPVQTRRLGWDLTLNGSYNSNEVLDLGGQPAGTGTTRNAVGFPINSIWDRPYTYADANNNRMIEASEVKVDTMMRFLGYSTPRAEVSIQNGFDLLSDGQVRLTFLMDGKFGGLLNNTTERFRCATRLNAQERVDPSAPLERQARCAAFLKAGNEQTNFGYFEKMSYWRLREVGASWRVPASLVSRLKIAKNATITLSGRNLKLWSDYTGVDPETSGPVGNTQDEFQITPPLQTWTLRFNFGF
ncbi:MAG: SusC/RagA family TonB-linked outer membrane protein [Phycisphaerae bacterium]|nr:SusC/RagA family TonB-linked outer membrane protein [Gemmatimonadaceae bacterium]